MRILLFMLICCGTFAQSTPPPLPVAKAQQLITPKAGDEQPKIIKMISVPAPKQLSVSWKTNDQALYYQVFSSKDLKQWSLWGNYTNTNTMVVMVESMQFWKVYGHRDAVTNHSVTVAWDYPIENAEANMFFVYFGGSKGDYTNRVAFARTNITASYCGTITNLIGYSCYYLSATAQNSSGLESDFSNEVEWESPMDTLYYHELLPMRIEIVHQNPVTNYITIK